MLRELRIQNFAIITELNLKFDDGLVVLTGETGAGKSIILIVECGFGSQSRQRLFDPEASLPILKPYLS